MSKTDPFDQIMNELFAKLENGLRQRQEAEVQITANTAAIRALANTCEDEAVKGEYLTAVDELSGKPGFVSAIRTLLRAHRDGLTPGVIKIAIQQAKLMDLTNYSNPAASIHTTLRRMVESGEAEPCTDLSGGKAYRLKPKTAGDFERELRQKFGLK
jgi:hypothetical protein